MDNSKDQESGINNVLNKLIRDSRDLHNDFERPDDDTITAYLLGEATQEQERAMKSALLQSESFRREILEMAEDMEKAGIPETEELKKKRDTFNVPIFEKFLAKYDEHPTPKPLESSLWKRLKEWRIPQLYAPVVAVAAVLTLMIIRTGVFAPRVIQYADLNMVTEQVELALLISTKTRDASQIEQKKIYPTSEEAALAEFRQLLKYNDGKLFLNPVKERPQQNLPVKPILLRFIDKSGNPIKVFPTNIPMSEKGTSDDIEMWLLTLPERSLTNFEMRRDTIDIQWKEMIDTRGCVTFTYPHKDGYQSVIGYSFDTK